MICKVWLIGRSYAAAIERRRDKRESSDDFYVKTVGPRIARSDIDTWLAQAREVDPRGPQALPTLLQVHARVTDLFTRISGLEKRSLASKYLHFHVPALFYIYDSRAVAAMRMLSSVVGRATSAVDRADVEYQRFAQKCWRLQEHAERELRHRLSPREVDNLLLAAYAKGT